MKAYIEHQHYTGLIKFTSGHDPFSPTCEWQVIISKDYLNSPTPKYALHKSITLNIAFTFDQTGSVWIRGLNKRVIEEII